MSYDVERTLPGHPELRGLPPIFSGASAMDSSTPSGPTTLLNVL